MLSRFVVFLAFVVLSTAGFPQEKIGEEHILARLAYHNSLAESDQSVRVCMAVYEDGFYRLLRGESLSMVGPAPEIPGRVIVQGTMSRGRLARLKAMLRELKHEKSQGGGIVLEGAEVFTAELNGDGHGSSFTWLDADHQNPFPASVAGLVRWLPDFRAENSSSITLHELSEISICPRAGAKPVVPTVAELDRNTK